MKFNKEFKDAVLQLSQTEKDKLLLQLLKKDAVLSSKLQFELLDDKSVDERQLVMEKTIKDKIAYFSTKRYSPSYLLKRLRSVSTLITAHVKITKDKLGDSYLNLVMLTETLDTFNTKLEKTTPGQSRKLGIYFVSKAFKVLIGITKLHEDYHLEHKENLERLGKLFSSNKHMIRTSKQNGFDINWLISTEIPENIEEIYKEIKKQGYLMSKTYLSTTDYNSRIN
ncbi:MAG: hypothetical protein QMC21_01670 [Flavobacteriales bacterium]|jgi:hypothetical protein|tara:strand:- start:8328 stop:9002 length:675 start_codon:yes stop_codon:yes gene_type:complete